MKASTSSSNTSSSNTSSSVLSLVRPHCAGIDMGSASTYVGFPDQSVLNYGTYTKDFKALISDLTARGINSVAMEATGVYGVILFDMLRGAGFEVFLVNPKYTKSRAGKKTDVQDCQWIQQLHSVDLLEGSFIPEAAMLELRTYVRLRLNHIEDQSKAINRMRKALIQMNVRLDTILSQVHGVSGMKMIRAILEGERDGEKLLSLCDGRLIKNKGQQIKAALVGYYQPQHLFSLQQAVARYDFIHEQIAACDQQIQTLLTDLTKDTKPPKTLPKSKPIRHNKPQIDQLQSYIWMLFGGRNLQVLPGFTDYTLLRLASEVGTDLSAFPSANHFTSWLGVAPGQHQSGKYRRRGKNSKATHGGQIFRELAQSLLQSKNFALGAFGRRIQAKKGPKVAIKAVARKLAVLYYNAIVKGMDYVEKGVKQYEDQYQQQQIYWLEKNAQKHGYQLVKEQPVGNGL